MIKHNAFKQAVRETADLKAETMKPYFNGMTS